MAVSKPAGIVPVGGVIAWLKSLTGCPALNDDFVECNGQTLSDAQSVFNTRVIPNLNTGTYKMLRGASTSGGTGGNDNHAHSISAYNKVTPDYTVCAVTTSGDTAVWDASSGCCGGGTGSLFYNTESASTLPAYYNVVWVIRVK